MRFVTAGESHGQALTAIVSDVPAGIALSAADIDRDLARRQAGYGRGGRMQIERDRVELLSGLRFGKTLGSPIALCIRNRDWQNWQERMATEGPAPGDLLMEQCPRPGHADLVGAMKIGSADCRDILERASARETAARVAAGAVAKGYLAMLGVQVASYVSAIGDVEMPPEPAAALGGVFESAAVEASVVRCPHAPTSEKMCAAIDAAKAAGESLGGSFVVSATGLLPGIGGYAEASERLTSRIGAALFSIPAIKGLEFGLGFAAAKLPGSQVHDPIIYVDDVRGAGVSWHKYRRTSNNAGGLEGGMTTGEPLLVHAAMKPIPTLQSPLATVDLKDHSPVAASKERSDVCAAPAAAVVAEAELAMVLANAYMDKFGRDDMALTQAAIAAYTERLRNY